MITYTIEIKQLGTRSTNLNKDFIAEVIWLKTGTNEDGISASIPGTTVLAEHEGIAIVPYENVTEDMVIAWIDEHTDESSRLIMETAINYKIEEQKNLLIYREPVWGSNTYSES